MLLLVNSLRAYIMRFGIILACFVVVGVSCLPQVSQVITDEATSPACRTAKGERGACVARERCDHGPTNVDHTLYAPRGYKRPCLSNEVCCRFGNVIEQDAAVNNKDSSQE